MQLHLETAVTTEELETQFATLLGEHNRLHDRVVRLEEWVDVVSSPFLKRLYFWLRGWRWKTLGRWRGKDLSQWPGTAHRWWLR